jgi:ABC-2 type transport system permease protein
MMLAWTAFRGAFAMHLRMYLIRQSRIITGLVTPAVTAAIAVLVLRHDAAAPDKYFRVMVGAGLAGMWGAVLGTALFTVRREREWYGTLPLLAGVPARLEAVFGGYLAAEACAGFVGIAVGLGTGALILGSPAGLKSPATLAVSLPLAALAVAAVAFPVMALVLPVPVLTRWINGIDYPVWILAGFLFPIWLLPGWTTPLSYALPVYWATEAMRQAAAPRDAWAHAAPMWLFTLGLCLCYAAAAAGLLRVVVRRAQRSGALIAG